MNAKFGSRYAIVSHHILMFAPSLPSCLYRCGAFAFFCLSVPGGSVPPHWNLNLDLCIMREHVSGVTHLITLLA